ncbi:isopentenyl-diphosphate Delta-isomerase [Blastochloris viridis]|uniref:Isopentenyl-diphosphate Delta-isomerase n=1 Tax=Blastochloris viridis TaxID=1079 RepID=A0A0H5BF16_BLAVI|nr:isopentenyl-diphosphate Delta-isomerase [Blastochloris viridis]ALK10366.1 Isopentenyl-diphosphate Delta-isomerase [Blastochloris viridis]BAR99694.1 isopentenyl-diphosphate delta-isomerase [Blastochloris viridis]CUU43028.1 Isopentenyl-diphosphate Delta-isomerase [Blastochloris viridis]
MQQIGTDYVATPRGASEHVVLLDGADLPIGTAEKLDAHRQGLKHLAISVIVRDGAGRWLLQRRAAGKYHSGGLWTNTCCSHPRPGEAVPAAAARRLVEEMGIACPLELAFVTTYRAAVEPDLIEHEVVHVFLGTYDGAISPDPDEVDAWRWVAVAELVEDIDARPDAYTVWFRHYVADFLDKMTD